MGFRSVMITEDKYFDEPLPKWFIEKWSDWWHFADDKELGLRLPASSIVEHKMYANREGFSKVLAEEWHDDLQKLLPADTDKLIVVWLHECGGITRAQIEKKRIIYSEPSAYSHFLEGPTHNYCYGCSDANEEQIRVSLRDALMMRGAQIDSKVGQIEVIGAQVWRREK